jgi:hypothetical protein
VFRFEKRDISKTDFDRKSWPIPPLEMARSSAEKMGGRLPQIHRISRGGRKLAVEFSQSHVAVFSGKVRKIAMMGNMMIDL